MDASCKRTAALPLFDVQFDDSGVISKIRSAKRPYSQTVDLKGDENGLYNSKDDVDDDLMAERSSQSPEMIMKYPPSKLRSGRSRCPQIAEEAQRGGNQRPKHEGSYSPAAGARSLRKR